MPVKDQLRRLQKCARRAAKKTSGLLALCKPKRMLKEQTHSKENAAHLEAERLLQQAKTDIAGSGSGSHEDASTPSSTPSTKPTGPLAIWIEDGHIEQPYADEEPRLFLTNHGGTLCVAMLPDRLLVEALQGVVNENRLVSRARRQHGRRMADLADVGDLLEDKLAATELEVAQQEHSTTNRNPELYASALAKREWLRQKQSMVETERRACREELDDRYRSQWQHLQTVIHTFEEMFVDSRLLDEEEEEEDLNGGIIMADNEDERVTPTVRALATELDMASLLSEAPMQPDGRRLRRVSGFDDLKQPGSDQLSNDGPSHGPTANEVMQIVGRYDSARMRLRVMDESFENRARRFEEDAAERDRKTLAGEEVESDTVLGLHELEITRLLTRQVIEAEEALEAVKADAVAAGIQLPGSDVESGFVDDVNDGYRISSEEEHAASVDKAKIRQWAALVTGSGDEEPAEAELDDWDAQSVDVSDSMSMVATDAFRQRIHRWRGICDAIKG